MIESNEYVQKLKKETQEINEIVLFELHTKY